MPHRVMGIGALSNIKDLKRRDQEAKRRADLARTALDEMLHGRFPVKVRGSKGNYRLQVDFHNRNVASRFQWKSRPFRELDVEVRVPKGGRFVTIYGDS